MKKLLLFLLGNLVCRVMPQPSIKKLLNWQHWSRPVSCPGRRETSCRTTGCQASDSIGKYGGTLASLLPES